MLQPFLIKLGRNEVRDDPGTGHKWPVPGTSDTHAYTGAGGSDEQANTLNQLLTEMDGFEGNPGIIVLAATNRAEVLCRGTRADKNLNEDIQAPPPALSCRQESGSSRLAPS